jgi:hypothetical protein
LSASAPAPRLRAGGRRRADSYALP